jgi:hypothetical protein
MAKFLVVYYGGKMETDPKKVEKSMAVWTKWFKDLGKAVVDMGAATQPGKSVSGAGVKAITGKPITGYTVIQADNLDAAAALVKTSPIVAEGGEMGIYTIMPT